MIGPKDTQPLEDFRLAWRFTAPHYELPETARRSVRPLTANAAARLMARVAQLHDSSYATRFDEIAERQVDGRFDPERESPVAFWLDELIPADPTDVLVSYDETTALQVPRDVFVEWWGAFLYPTEDVIVIPADASWSLAWDYKQNLYFARARTEDPG